MFKLAQLSVLILFLTSIIGCVNVEPKTAKHKSVEPDRVCAADSLIEVIDSLHNWFSEQNHMYMHNPAESTIIESVKYQLTTLPTGKQSLIDGCSCWFSKESDSSDYELSVFQIQYNNGDQEKAYLGVNGKTMELISTSGSEFQFELSNHRTFEGNGVSAVLIPQKSISEYNEGYQSSILLYIFIGNEVWKKALIGGCGC